LAAYLDKFLSALHQLEILPEETFSESQMKCTLMKNVRNTTGMAHPVQKCCDDFYIMPFDAMAEYLSENSMNVGMEASIVTARKNIKSCLNILGRQPRSILLVVV
jgi:hypothetical protein